jgi:hypothetical protein
MDDVEARLECLRPAAPGVGDAEEVTKRASTYANFVLGSVETRPAYDPVTGLRAARPA